MIALLAYKNTDCNLEATNESNFTGFYIHANHFFSSVFIPVHEQVGSYNFDPYG